MNITVLIDPETIPDEDPLFEGKSERVCEQMEFHIIETLRLLNHEVQIVPFRAPIERTIKELKDAAPDLAFNLTEHVAGDRRRDMQVTALLELLQIPYTGTGSMGLMMCRDKAICKRLLSHHRIRVPQFAFFQVGRSRKPRKIHFPALVKPVFEDGSDGITLASLVQNSLELEQRVAVIHERMNQPAICEEYIKGRELYVGLLGNERLHVLPPRELRFGRTEEGGPNFATAKVKQDDAYRRKWGISYEHASVDDALKQRLARASKRIYRLLYLRDYGRIDFRVTEDDEIVFLEANPNPDLSMGDELAESAERAGIEYIELIRRIINLALRRTAPKVP